MQISDLSANAQALVQQLEHEANAAAAIRGAGYAQVHEDRVGGVDQVMPAIVELNEAGVNVSVSAGERDRMIGLTNTAGAPVRIQRPK